MTRKDYVFIAKVLNNARTLYPTKSVINNVVMMFSRELEKEPNFDRAKFWQAVKA